MSNIPSINIASLSPNDFTDTELDLPYYLTHFKQVADSVHLDGPNRGFINISVWRNPKDNLPHNARIMENNLALTYFYCTNRPYNIYYNHPAVKERLEAALDFWCRIQSPNGRFSEYGPENWNLAATAFATKFMGQALHLLHTGPSIDPTLHKRVIETDRKALHAVFTNDAFQKHGRSFTNQYSNAWGGALAYLALYPDPEIERLFDQRLEESRTAFQSPAGYFYEKDGPDWGYFLGTHHSDIHAAWQYAHNTPRANAFLEQEQRWYDWFSYNVVPEPNGSGYIINRAIETRQKKTFLTEARTNLAGPEWNTSGDIEPTALGIHLECPRAYARTVEAHTQDIKDARKRLEALWPNIPPLQIGQFWAFSPYAFLHRDHIHWRPTQAQKTTATTKLPYIARDRFTHQRADSRHPLVLTYIRRPIYYATFNTGPSLSPQQRYGLGLLYHPKAGALLQSQTNTNDATWGTSSNNTLYEALGITATYQIHNQTLTPQPGAHDLPDGNIEITYPLEEQGHKTITFSDNTITVAIHHNGTFTETIPLLQNTSDTLQQSDNHVTLKRDSLTLTINAPNAQTITHKKTDHTSGPRNVVAVHLTAENTLTYTITLT